MAFTVLDTPVYDSNGEEYTHKCGDCGKARGQEYFGCWIEEDSGEFGEDRFIVECFSCGNVEEGDNG